MKRFLAVFLLLALLTAGCGVQMPGGEATDKGGFFTLPSDFSMPTTRPTEPEAPGMTAQQVRLELTRLGKRFAVAYLGYKAWDGETVWSYLESKPQILEQLSFLREIPETHLVGDGMQGEVYCIIPVDPEATIKVYSGNSNETDTPSYDTLVYEGAGSEPFLLVCNAYSQDTRLTIDYSDNTAWSWLPQLDQYLFVSGYWGGEYSASEDGYDSLDLTPYSQLLLDQYRGMLAQEESTWIVPTREDLIGAGWFEEGYEPDGAYYLWQLEPGESTMDVCWDPGGNEEIIHYSDAPWKLENKDGIAVLSVDFGEFAGLRSYNILLDKETKMLYTAVDATEGPVSPEWEVQYRFLLPTIYRWEPEDLVGTWISSHTEVEGDVNYNDSATVQILVGDNGEYRMWYMDREFPQQNFDDVRLRVEAGDTFGYFEDCAWLAVVEYTDPLGVSRTLALTTDGLLVIRDYWEVDGAPMVGYRWYGRAE